MKYLIQALAALFLLSAIQPAAMAQEPPTLTFGLVPQQSATKLATFVGADNAVYWEEERHPACVQNGAQYPGI